MNNIKRDSLELLPEHIGGKCVFCDKKLEENFFSGSYETYLEKCDCEGSTTYYAALKDIRTIMKPIIHKIDIIQLEEQIKHQQQCLEGNKKLLENMQKRKNI